MRVIVAGGRDLDEADVKWLNYVVEQLTHLGATEVVSGKARGGDRIGELAAQKLGLPVMAFPAQWDLFGKSAGFRRNEQMARYADACVCLPGGKGTQHMYEMASKMHLTTRRLLLTKES